MGHQQERKTAKGTRKDGTAMRQTEAFNKFSHARYSTRWGKFEIFDDFGIFDDVYASARTDSINHGMLIESSGNYEIFTEPTLLPL